MLASGLMPERRPRALSFAAALAAALSFLPLPTAAAAPARELRFDVRLDDSPIGSQVFRIEDNGQRSRVSIEAALDVKFFFVTAYTYRHRNVEEWDGSCLASIESTTDDNGKPFRVRGASESGAFVVETTKGRETLPSCVVSFPYWNPALLGAGRLLNSQTGDYESVSLRELGTAKVTYRGSQVDARHVLLEGDKIRIELWYALEGGEWLALESTTTSGRRLKYLRQ